MACRLPGGIDSPELLWDALLRGAELITDIPPDRWDADDYFDPEPGAHGRSVSRWGSFLDDIAGFDSEFFGIDDDEATALDPQQRLLLETSWEALEHAGIPPHAVTGSLTGVFVGLTNVDYQSMAAQSQPMQGTYEFHSNSLSMASGRIAHALRVHGPAITVDTAGSSSLLAVHMACRSLNDGESDLALAGGACVMLEPRRFAAASAQGMLSPTGRCRAFDAEADGTVIGEGAGMVLLKRLPDAIRDGDRILAVVRGTAANQDGHTVHVGTPSRRAQSAVYRKALAAAGVDARTVGMVEAHGAGSPLGDPVEYAGLAEVYGVDGPCALTSAKPNFGHTQSAAGVIGLMKAVLALGHGVVPQHLHFTRVPEGLAPAHTKLFVPQQISPWTTNGGQPRRAAVSAYGMSGTNVHGILEQAPVPAPAREMPGRGPQPGAPLLIPLSATSADELCRTAGRLADWVRTHDDVPLADLAYTLARRRTHRPVRATVLARDGHELVGALQGLSAGSGIHLAAADFDKKDPVWVFSGVTSHLAGMGAELLADEPAFAAIVALAEPVILRECGFSVTEALSADLPTTGEDRVQPTLFVMQVALAAALRAHGVRPGAVIGHSVGEVAAAVVAGALSLEDGLHVVCRRAVLMARLPGSAATASVELPAQQVLSELALRGGDVVVAMVPSPESTVVAGPAAAVRDLVAAWEQRGVVAHERPADVASHSPQVDPILDELTESLSGLRPMTPQVPFYSTTSYDPREQPACDARYWAANARRMVRFSAAVRAAVEDGHRIFAELSPHPVLTDAVERTARGLDVPVAILASLHRDRRPAYGVRDFVGRLHCAGAAVDFAEPYPHGHLVDAPLPTWTRRRLWFATDAGTVAAPGGHTLSVHPLLGPHVHLQEEPERHVWQADLGTDVHPWLGEHRIDSATVLPAAAYCEMALAAARAIFGDLAEARDILFEQPLALEARTTVDAVATVTTPGVLDFTVATRQRGGRIRHASAVLAATDPGDDRPATRDLAGLLAAHPARRDGAEIRDRLRRSGIDYGPTFATLVAVHTGGAVGTLLAELAPTGPVRADQSAYGIHPAWLDACLQTVAAHRDAQPNADAPITATGVRRLRVFGPARSARHCLALVTSAGADGIEADVELLDQHGEVLVQLQGLRCSTGAGEADRRERVLSDRLLTVEWQPWPLPDRPVTDAGTWLIVCCPPLDAVSGELRVSLEGHGAHCKSMNWPHRTDGSNVARLREHLRGEELTGLVVVTAPNDGASDQQSMRRARDYVRHLVHIARELADVPGESPRLYVVTRAAQSVLDGERPNLEQAGLRGLIRVIGNEYPQLNATHVDLDDGVGDGVAEQLARQLLAGSQEDETAWRHGGWYTARLHHMPLRAQDRRTTVAEPESDGMRLQLRTPGDPESLEMVACERLSPGPGQIEVAVRASSVNFTDVLTALGRHPVGEDRPPTLGTDFAGVVTAVGPDVSSHRVGDRVGGVSADGCWGTFLTCAAHAAIALPSGLSDGAAAAATTAHAIAYHGLHDLARLAAGDRVLIHSATGGVGTAAIAIARAAGAEIFATAGSAARRALLREQGIEHVYDSRDLEFAALIRRDTDGYGVDVVLNSLTGAGQRAGLELLAYGGRFVEIGQRDIYADTRLGLGPFRRNLSFYAVDLVLMAEHDPERFRGLLTTVYRLIADGALPAPECTHHPLSNAAEAIRAMADARHTGRLVLDVPAHRHAGVVVPPANARVFTPDGAYVLTGGLGDVGLFLAEQMAAAGAGRIVLSSRREPTRESLERIDAIRAAGGDVVVVRGDIADPATAERLVATANATGLRVRGVLHAAAVVGDSMLPDITDELVERDWAPKVYGAWNLHTATAAEPLDWFCSFSSTTALVGAPGQGANAAANSWLDAFARWRRDQGLPANTIAWGQWAQDGPAATGSSDTDRVITDDDAAYAFETLLRHDRAYSGYASMAGTPWLSTFTRRTPFAEALRESRENPWEASGLRDEIEGLAAADRLLRLRRMVSDHVTAVVRRSIDPDRPLPECGIDSLGALELCTRIEAETGVRVRPAEITTIRGLAELLCDRLTSAEVA